MSSNWFPSVLLTCLACTGVSAQEITLERAYPTVTQNGEALPLPWFGGLNAPQFQAADLDGDGAEDLLIFDRGGQQLLAARRTGPDSYQTAPDLLAGFPTIDNWLVVRDYNGDGVPDLFSHDSDRQGVRMHRGSRGENGLLSYERVFPGGRDVISFPINNTPIDLFIDALDYPAIEDVDGDGDLDILTFSALGGFLEYYQNLAVERGVGLDSIVMSLGSNCWGGFFESGLDSSLDLADTPGECFDIRGRRPIQGRHAGSTILAFDYNGNGLLDVLLGDVSFPSLTLGVNGGSREEAFVTDQDPNWNSTGTEANIPFFPAAFHLDIDQDGDRDVLGAPTSTNNGADVEVAWLYTNEGGDAAPDFQFTTDRFLVGGMIDVGSRSNVTTFDYDADGRVDLIVGNNDQYAGGAVFDSRLRLFRNVTENGVIAFELVDEDYLGLSAYVRTTWAYAPTFGDIDGDGDADAVLGERDGQLILFENEAGPDQPASFAAPVFEWLGIDVKQFAKPTIADLDRDGLPDLIVGGFDGRIRFFRNVGTPTEPSFVADATAPGNIQQLGGIDTRSPGSSTGYPTPTVISYPDYTLLLTGNEAGTLEAYRLENDSPLATPFAVLDTVVGNLSVGAFSSPGLADFNGDGTYEVVVGNERGGVEFFRTNLNTDGTVPLFTPPAANFRFTVSPNPVVEVATISGWPEGSVDRVDIHDIQGRLVWRQRIDRARTRVQWEVVNSRPGIYLVTLKGQRGIATKKIILN